MLPSRECARPAGARSRHSKAEGASAIIVTRDAGMRHAASGRAQAPAGREP